MGEATPVLDPSEHAIDALIPTASVVIPTHGRRELLLRVLRALVEQTVAPESFEALVICDGDVDGSVAACQAVAATLPYTLRVFAQVNQGPAAARNRGVAEARAPLIVFVDDDVVPAPELLAVHLAAQQGQENLVTIGPLLPPPDFRLNAWGAWEESTLVRQYDAMTAGQWRPTYRQFYTGNASILRRHVLAAGGFDPRFRRAEDVELALRLREHALQFTFLPEARGWHYVSRSLDAWQRMAAAYGRADVAMARAGWLEVLVIAVEQYHWRRSRFVQVLAALCAGNTRVVRALVSFLGSVAISADRLGAQWLANAACSLVFNLQYYDGVANELGGSRVFRDLMRRRGKELCVNGQQPTQYLLGLLASKSAV